MATSLSLDTRNQVLRVMLQSPARDEILSFSGPIRQLFDIWIGPAVTSPKAPYFEDTIEQYFKYDKGNTIRIEFYRCAVELYTTGQLDADIMKMLGWGQ